MDYIEDNEEVFQHSHWKCIM